MTLIKINKVSSNKNNIIKNYSNNHLRIYKKIIQLVLFKAKSKRKILTNNLEDNQLYSKQPKNFPK